MSTAHSQQLQQAINERMAAGGYATEDELLLDAMLVFQQVESSRNALRAEIQERLDRTGKPAAEPLDFDALIAELRANSSPSR